MEALRQKKEDRAKQFLEVKTQIANICGEIAATPAAGFYLNGGDQDMSLRKLEEYNSQLQVLQQERVSPQDSVCGKKQFVVWGFWQQRTEQHAVQWY